MTKQFEINKIYTTFLATNFDTKLSYRITRRTAKSVWIRDLQCPKEPIRRRAVKVHEGIETIFPEGRYSMAPILSAE
jgi:hypothetical protein